MISGFTSIASGVSRREAARQFKVSASSAIRFVRQAMEVGHAEETQEQT